MKSTSFDSRLDGIVRDFEHRVARLLRSDAKTVADIATENPGEKKFALLPITDCIAVFNVSRENRMAIYSSGRLNSKEYAAAIRMLELDRQTMLESEAAAQAIEAQRAATPQSDAVGDESAVGNADASQPTGDLG